MHDGRRFDALLALVDRLVEANATTPVLVEGPRDVAALREVGCAGTLRALKGPVALHDLAHALAPAHPEVNLLPDWDRAGLALRDAALAQLRAHGIRVDLHFHERMVADTDLTMKDVETLPAILARGMRRHHGRTLAEHVRARSGDPLGVETLRDGFASSGALPAPGPRERRPARKRRADPGRTGPRE